MLKFDPKNSKGKKSEDYNNKKSIFPNEMRMASGDSDFIERTMSVMSDFEYIDSILDDDSFDDD